MLVIPAIDLKDGKCVRLQKGEFGTEKKVSDSAVATAKEFIRCGAKLIHMVDLDGALAGVGKNREIVKDITGLPGARVELGGGLRDMASLEAAAELGVWRMVIGSAAVRDPQFVARAVERYGERIAVGIDAQNGYVKTDGWTVSSGLKAVDFAGSMQELGVKTIIFTDIDTDGMLSGPPLEAMKQMREALHCELVASGGVSCLEDVVALKKLGADGVIIGKAYYAGRIDLKKAIEEGGR